MSTLLNEALFLIVIVVGLVGLGYEIHRRARRYIYSPSDPRKAAKQWLPRSLHDAVVAAVEENIHFYVDVADFGKVCVSARPDMVYRTSEGLYTPVEYKTRRQAKVHQSDIDQLSLQAWLLRQKGQPTTELGLIVFDSEDIWSRRSKMVQLKNDQECMHLLRRYLTLVNGADAPRKANDRRCKTCAHSQRCFSGFARIVRKW